MNELTWRQSTYCGGGGNNCVELATAEDGVALRESEIPGTVISTRPATLRAFLRAAKAGRFDGPAGTARPEAAR
ncbi:DUF397 domain-containing protein [Streptomyces sp. NPDC018031]|uniref:DUF397 domain-containing protein n=1 Tax=Streptomyces sp. NPDC018031 TaxID=3365033 RepID=UPI003796FA41